MDRIFRIVIFWAGGFGLCGIMAMFFVSAGSADGLIHTDPQEFLLEPVDLPGQQDYFIPSHQRSVVTNDLVIYLLGDEAGEKRVDSTGRLTGWQVHFRRVAGDGNGPDQIAQTIMQFASSQGALMNLEQYSLSGVYPQTWTRLKSVPGLGEASLAEMRQYTRADGQAQVTFAVSFTVRNIGVRIEVSGVEGQVSLEDAISLARIVADRLRGATLLSSPVPTPTRVYWSLENAEDIYR
jgi:hypothetical protein